MSVSKPFRIFSFLLSVLLLFPVFSVGVSAADEDNLIDSNLSNWTVLHPEQCSVIPATSSLYLVRIYGVQKPPAIPEGPSPIWYLGGAFDLTDSNITVGNKYTLSFNFPDPVRYVSSSTGSNSFIGDNSGTLIVGLCSYLSDDTVEPIEGCYFIIDKNNFNSVKDTDIQLSFEMPSGVVNPCICFYYMNFGGTNTVCFYLKDFKLIDESKAEEDNFFSRLFEWFEVKFKAIGDSFTDLKDSFVGKINDLKESFQKKIDELKQSFIDLKNDLIEGIKGLFVPDEEDITAWKAKLEKLLSDNLGFIYQIPKLFEDIVTKLKLILIRDDFSYSFKLPSFSFNLFGYDVLLWDSEAVDFDAIFEVDVFKTLYDIYKVCVNIIFGFALVKYGWRVLEELMSN